MTKPVPSSISDTKPHARTALTVALLLAGLFALDRTVGAALGWAYNHSSASPLGTLHASQADTVVIGTSTARYALVPSAWRTRLVNLAQDGQTVLFSIALARILLSENTVKRIIIGIDPYDLNSGLSNPSAARIWRIAPTVRAFPDIAPLLTATRPTNAALSKLSAAWIYRGTVPQIVRSIRSGFTSSYTALTPGTPIEPRKANGRETARPFSTSLEPYIDALVMAARGSGTQIVLVVTPAYKDNRAARPDQAQLLDELRARLKDAPVCDLTGIDTPALQELRLQPANFHDNIHLTEAGGGAYTRELQTVIDQRCR